MSVVFKTFFLFLVYGSFAYANINEEEKSSLKGFSERERQILELERILESYSLLAEKGVSFGMSNLDPNQVTVEFLNPVPDPNQITVEILDPAPNPDQIIEQPLDPVTNPNETFIKRSSLEESLYRNFNELLEKEKNYLEKEEEFKKFLNFYYFLQSLKPHFQILKELQGKISESFSNLNEVVMQNNQMNKETEEFHERHKSLENKRGRLNFIEIRSLIDFNREKEVFSRNGGLKKIFDETTVYIRSLYGQIDSEKERLLNLGNPVADILCDSDFYKSSMVSCFSVFDLKDREKLEFFIDTLSPEKWQELDIKTQEIIDDSNYETSLKESLWQLAQDSDFSGIKTLFKTADFFRWIYFQLREELKAGVDPDLTFSWDLILEKLEEEKKEKQNIELESILISLNKTEVELKTLFYSNEMEEREREYFYSLVVARVLIDSSLYDLKVELEETDISCLKLELRTTSKWSDCINKYFNFLVSQEDLKDQWEKDLNENLRELVARASSLKEQLENQSN